MLVLLSKKDKFKGEYDCDEWIDNRGYYIEIRRLRSLRREIFRRDWSGEN